MGTRSWNGAQKAAILLLSFGEEISAEIFKHLTEFEIKRVGSAMSRLGRLEQEDVDKVIDEFYALIQQNKQYFYGGADYTRKIISSAFRGNESEDILEQLEVSSSRLESLALIEARTLAGFLRNEHPQTMALILAHLDAQKMGETLKLLPQGLYTEVLFRIANLGR